MRVSLQHFVRCLHNIDFWSYTEDYHRNYKYSFEELTKILVNDLRCYINRNPDNHTGDNSYDETN